MTHWVADLAVLTPCGAVRGGHCELVAAGHVLQRPGPYETVFSWLEDYSEDLRKITVLVLVMHGDDDQIVPYASSVPRAVDLLRDGALKTYPGYPHGMLTTRADVLNPDLLAFIRR